jgi:hypothetical protein
MWWEVDPRATAKAATLSVDSLLARTPFAAKAIRADEGSQFRGGFEQRDAEPSRTDSIGNEEVARHCQGAFQSRQHTCP